MGDRKDNSLPLEQEPRIDLHYLMTQLCHSAKVATDGYDICSQSFAESVLDYVCQDLALLEGIRTSVATRRPFNCGARRGECRETQRPPTPTYHSNVYGTSSELLQLPSSESKKPAMHSSHRDITDTTSVLSPESSVTSSPVSRASPEVICIISPARNGVTSTHSSSSPASNGNKHDFVTTTPTIIPTFPGESHQSVFSTLEDLGQSPSSNETEDETSSGVEDNFFNELIQTPPPPSSRKSNARQSKNTNRNKIDTRRGEKDNVNNKGDNRRVSNNKGHAPRHVCVDGFYFECICGCKYRRKTALTHHIRYFTAEWKFNCLSILCPKKFYYFYLLKNHLKKIHGMKNELEDYDTGCSFCGMYFHTRTGLSKHQKTQHNIHDAQGVVPVVNSPRISGMTPIWSGMTPLRPRMTPLRSGMTPLRLGMTPLRSGMTPLRSRMTPLRSVMSPMWSGQDMPSRSPEFLHTIPQKNLRCKCNKQCQNFTEFNVHIRMNKVKHDAIKCNSCHKKFIHKCVFKQHQKLHCSQIIPPPSSQDSPQIEDFNLISDDEQEIQKDSLVSTDVDMSSLTHTSTGSLLPSNANSPPQTANYGNPSEGANFKLETDPQSSSQTGDRPLPPKMDKQRNHEIVRNDDLKAKTDRKEDLVIVCRFYSRKDKRFILSCITCGSPPFLDDVNLLRGHMSSKHASKRNIRCGTCKVDFGSRRSFNRHWKQCSKSAEGTEISSLHRKRRKGKKRRKK